MEKVRTLSVSFKFDSIMHSASKTYEGSTVHINWATLTEPVTLTDGTVVTEAVFTKNCVEALVKDPDTATCVCEYESDGEYVLFICKSSGVKGLSL